MHGTPTTGGFDADGVQLELSPGHATPYVQESVQPSYWLWLLSSQVSPCEPAAWKLLSPQKQSLSPPNVREEFAIGEQQRACPGSPQQQGSWPVWPQVELSVEQQQGNWLKEPQLDAAAFGIVQFVCAGGVAFGTLPFRPSTHDGSNRKLSRPPGSAPPVAAGQQPSNSVQHGGSGIAPQHVTGFAGVPQLAASEHKIGGMTQFVGDAPFGATQFGSDVLRVVIAGSLMHVFEQDEPVSPIGVHALVVAPRHSRALGQWPGLAPTQVWPLGHSAAELH